ncbi:MAG: ribonuclease HII [Bdellovibrionales bacterium]|nr:ribonuclease HII [Bdellovibrionales bacterium]
MALKKPECFPDLTSEVASGFLFSAFAEGEELPLIIGVDEVGRGCLAGPVVAAAAALGSNVWTDLAFEADGTRAETKIAEAHLDTEHKRILWSVRDSKLIPEDERPSVRDAVKAFVRGYAVAEASVEEINRLNILYASHLAMERAVADLEKQLGREADVIIIDGNMIPKQLKTRGPKRAIALIKGDLKSFSIACASIIAKTYRDDMMIEFESQYPGYGLAKHKGYPTPFHKAQILALGVTPLHRAAFKGVANVRDRCLLAE